jgi:hypothetical protein
MNEEHRMNDRQSLSSLSDILFMPLFFYLLTQWGVLTSWQSIVLWCALLMIVYNEMMSVRESYVVYNMSIYTIDLFSIFFYVLAVNALSKEDPLLGYSPTFWIAIGFLWTFYAIWDFLMIKSVNDDAKSDYRKWALYMGIAALVTFGCYFVIVKTSEQIDIKYNLYACRAAEILALGIILWALYLWIKDRHRWFLGIRARP